MCPIRQFLAKVHTDSLSPLHTCIHFYLLNSVRTYVYIPFHVESISFIEHDLGAHDKISSLFFLIDDFPLLPD